MNVPHPVSTIMEKMFRTICRGGLGRNIFIWFMILSLIPLLVVSTISYRLAHQGLSHKTTEHLNAVAAMKARHILSYFQERLTDGGEQSREKFNAETLRQFSAAFAQSGKPVGQFVRSFKWALINDERTADLKTFQMIYGYSDLMLIDREGNILYTAMSKDDLGTNLFTGKNSGTLLASVARKAFDSGRPAFSDFEFHKPLATITGFLFHVITDEGGEKIGLMGLGLSSQQVNAIMTEKTGMEETGESYLVGGDLLMRSDSRFSEESTILKQKVDTQGARQWRESLAGGEKSRAEEVSVYPDYRGIPVLGVHKKLEIGGVSWGVMVEVDEAEAFGTLFDMRRLMWLAVLITAALVVVAGWFTARSISVPLNNAIGTLTTTSSQIAATVTQHERTASQQAAAANETSATITELSDSSRQSAEQAANAAAVAEKASMATVQGGDATRQAVAAMSNLKDSIGAMADQILHLGEQTGQIGSIAVLLKDLAGQINMLALNAAVEAARAGEHGKGFAVVAGEIRKLADQSRKSAEQTAVLVADIQKATNTSIMMTEEGTRSVNEVTQLSQKVAELFNNLSGMVGSVSENAQQVMLNARQQSAAFAQVVEATSSIAAGTRETVAGISQTRVGVQKLNEAAENLKAIV